MQKELTQYNFKKLKINWMENIDFQTILNNNHLTLIAPKGDIPASD